MAVELKGLGLVTVASAASPEALADTEVLTPGASIQAPASNTGNIRIGGSDVAVNFSASLRPGESMEITGPLVRGIEEEFDLSRVYIDVDVDGEGAVVGYWARRP